MATAAGTTEVSMGMMKEYREFAMRGNVLDLAIGVVIGAAFGKIVSSMVADIITPPLGLLLGGMNFSALAVTLKEGVEGVSEPVTLNYGLFIQAVVDFLIVAWVIFLVVKGVNRLRRKQEVPPPPDPVPTKEEVLLTEIRDLLKTR